MKKVATFIAVAMVFAACSGNGSSNKTDSTTVAVDTTKVDSSVTVKDTTTAQTGGKVNSTTPAK